MALKAGYKGIKEVGPGLDYDNTTGLLTLDGESSLKLDNLEDVSIDTPLGGDVLQYDSSNEEWTNETPDTVPIEDSPQLITSGAVYAGLKTEDDKISAIWSSNARTGVHNLLENNANNGSAGTSPNEVTWEVVDAGDEAGAVTVNGTPASDCVIMLNYNVNLKSGVTYRLSGGVDTSEKKILTVAGYNGTTWVKNLVTCNDGTAKTFTPDFSGYTNIGVDIIIRANETASNVKFYPMICYASDTDTTYTPYAMTNGELTEKVTPDTSAVTDIINGASVDNTVGNVLTKIGNVVYMNVGIVDATITTPSSDVLYKIPSGFRPPKNVVVPCMPNHSVNIKSDGDVLLRETASSEKIYVSASWVVS